MKIPPVEELLLAASFVSGLPSFLRREISLGEARAALDERLANRENDFLELVKGGVFENPTSPYLTLLRVAGCEWGDLRKLVRKNGVDDALAKLFRDGVYLTTEEFKGRVAVVRGNTTINVEAALFRNPAMKIHVPMQSSGSTGARTTVGVSFQNIRDMSVNRKLVLNARGGLDWRHAIWMVPGGASVIQNLVFSSLGASLHRWFSQVDPFDRSMASRYAWSARAMHWISRLNKRPLPLPEFVPPTDPRPIIRWIRELLDRGETPHLFTYPSSAAFLCETATTMGYDLKGSHLTVGGEPCTEQRLSLMRASGAELCTHYGSAESATVGQGCLTPEYRDEIHFFSDFNAIIQPPCTDTTTDMRPRPFFMSSLRPSARNILLNVSLGDEGMITERRCGCPLDALGWKTHLYGIRSDQKLTAAGMNLLDADVIRLLEEILPAKFGGGPLDYQLVEDESDNGYPELKIVVSPSVAEPIDTAALVETFLNAISAGAGSIVARLWKNTGLVRVVRGYPVIVPSGKILHLHSRRK